MLKLKVSGNANVKVVLRQLLRLRAPYSMAVES